MRSALSLPLIVAALSAMLPAALPAQVHEREMAAAHRPGHEFGADVRLAFYSFGDLGASRGESGLRVLTPVDLRVGFLGNGSLSVEPRLGFSLDTKAGTDRSGNAATAYRLAPEINFLHRLGEGSGMHGLMGRYATLGAGLVLADFGASSATQFSVNAGLGTRWATGLHGAFRLEGFARYAFENRGKGVPAEVSAGFRLGVSVWN